MTKINLNSVCTTYYDIHGDLIAVATQEISRDGSKKFKLYGTDENLKDFDLMSTSNSPVDFDAILYPNHIVSASASKSRPIRTKINLTNTDATGLTKSASNLASDKKSVNLKHKKLF